MQEKLNKCPKCGSKINKVINKKTNQVFFKCSNEKCHFRLNKEYSEMDVDLQGLKLNSVCRGCGYPLEVACGPHGLYARCYQCSYDTNPKKEMQKWSNARSINVKQEIKALIQQYQKEAITEFGFDEDSCEIIPEHKAEEGLKEEKTTSGYNIVKEIEKEKKHKKARSHAIEKILLTMLNNKNKMFSAEDLAKQVKIDSATARTYLKQLREAKEIKIVGYIDANNAGPLTVLYQTKENPKDKVKTVTEEDGYITINKFFKENKNLFMNSTTPTTLQQLIKINGFEMKPLLTSKGILRGYKKEDLLKLSNKKEETEKPVVVQQKLSFKTPRYNSSDEIRNDIISYLKENINRGISSKELKDHFKLPISVIRYNLNRLKTLKKVKVVDTEESEGKAGYPKSLVQVVDSPLPNLKITKDNRRYMSISNFLSKNKKIRMSVQGASEILEKAGAEKIHISIKNKLCKGYSIEDLNKYLLRRELPEPTTPVVLTKEQETNLFSAVQNWFKKNKKEDNESEIISF